MDATTYRLATSIKRLIEDSKYMRDEYSDMNDAVNEAIDLLKEVAPSCVPPGEE